MKLGDKVKDKISGFTGIMTAKVEYLNGCNQIGIAPKVDKEGKMRSVEYFDDIQVVLVGKGVNLESKPTGGPQRDAPSR